ncbi:hypothetical protein LTR37_015609 [Vermiconidia calcicola]|uniref:Uncharacterized protein n=1 Tax=Vermiconidia calcicola TaxID=1690605 RepID=A0ACC3MQN2_9PEZI|nr:hypothetical protein LTR37_015609 [Vermiconidia calcicola]
MEPCPLLELPAEVRNNIYERALHEPEGLHFHQVEGKGKLIRYEGFVDAKIPIHLRSSTSNRMSYSMALLSVCKQVRNEVKELFFALNTIEIKAEVSKSRYTPWTLTGDFSRLLRTFFQRLGATNVALIPRFVLQIGSCNASQAKNAPTISRQYWDLARTVTEKLGPITTLRTDSIYVAAGFKFFYSMSAWHRGDDVCPKERTIQHYPCMNVNFALPPTDTMTSIIKASRAFAEKIRFLESHRGHYCVERSDPAPMEDVMPLPLPKNGVVGTITDTRVRRSKGHYKIKYNAAAPTKSAKSAPTKSGRMAQAPQQPVSKMLSQATSPPTTPATTSQAAKRLWSDAFSAAVAGAPKAKVQASKKIDSDQNTFASLERRTLDDTTEEEDFFETMATPSMTLRRPQSSFQQTTSAPKPTTGPPPSTGKSRLPWATNAAVLIPSGPARGTSSRNPILLE